MIHAQNLVFLHFLFVVVVRQDLENLKMQKEKGIVNERLEPCLVLCYTLGGCHVTLSCDFTLSSPTEQMSKSGEEMVICTPLLKLGLLCNQRTTMRKKVQSKWLAIAAKYLGQRCCWPLDQVLIVPRAHEKAMGSPRAYCNLGPVPNSNPRPHQEPWELASLISGKHTGGIASFPASAPIDYWALFSMTLPSTHKRTHSS